MKIDIDSLGPGHETDLLVYEKVFGGKLFSRESMVKEALEVWKQQPECKYFFKGFSAWRDGSEIVCRQDVAPYTTSIIAVMQIWNLFSPIQLRKLPLNNEQDLIECEIPEIRDKECIFHRAVASTEELAICKVVLKVIMSRENEK